MIVFVCWIASRMATSECHIMAWDAITAMIENSSKYSLVDPPQRRHSTPMLVFAT
jgi:hypothetical protein